MKTPAQSREAVRRHRARKRDLATLLAAEGVKFHRRGPLAGLPKVATPARKAAAVASLEVFALTYLGHVFTLPLSEGQRADFRTMQDAATDGGRYAFASPRGDGKTSRCEALILWASLTGRRRCCVVVGADLGAAAEIVESCKQELRTNERLRADFPLPCWAACLADDTALKARGFTWGGADLGFRWGKGAIVLPVLAGADASGAALIPRGLTGRLRGMRLKIGARAVRPDLYVIDDPQTDESAASAAQVDTREKLVLGACMGSAGPGVSLAAVMPCTIIRHGDLAARFLDRKRHPDWQGTARGIVKTWPESQETLWKGYSMKRKTESHEAANAFYQEHREAMDAGAAVDWPERFTPGKEVSALQAAENLRCDLGEDVFQAEYMNDPRENHPSLYTLTPELVASRIHLGRRAFELPPEARTIVAATDLNLYGLTSAALGFANDQTAWAGWYGIHDHDGRGIVSGTVPESEAKRALFEALVEHGRHIAGLPLLQDGHAARVGMWVIDAGFWPDIVRRYVDGPGRALGIQVLPARGFNAEKYRPTGKGTIGKPREQCHFTESAVAGRFLAFNSCFWREVSQRAWLASPNAPGSLSLFEGGNHGDFAEQICRERLLEKLQGEYGPLWRWRTAPGPHDYGDAVTMCYAGAAWGGVGTAGAEPPRERPKARVVIYRPSERHSTSTFRR